MQPRFPEGNGFMEVTIAICAILSLLFTTPTNYYEYRHEGNLYYVWVMSWTMSLWWLMRILKPPSKTESPDHMSWRAYVADSLHTGSWLIFYVSYLLFLFYRDVLARQLSTSVIVFYTLIVRFVIVPRLPALTEAERARVADWLQTDARVEKMKQYVNAGPRNASILAHTMANKQHQSCEVCKSTPAFCHFCSDFERDMVSRIYSTWRWNEPEYFNYRFPTQETDLSPGLVSCLSEYEKRCGAPVLVLEEQKT